MNKLHATITEIETADSISMVNLDVDGIKFCSIIIETPETASYLKTGNQVEIVFKETEVSIAKRDYSDISLSNKLPVKINRIIRGKILSELLMDFYNNRISSIIPTHFVDRQKLKIGDEVYAMIKSNEIMIMP
ncbi:molybdopterin-binding protein [Bacteroidota bacterium]